MNNVNENIRIALASTKAFLLSKTAPWLYLALLVLQLMFFTDFHLAPVIEMMTNTPMFEGSLPDVWLPVFMAASIIIFLALLALNVIVVGKIISAVSFSQGKGGVAIQKKKLKLVKAALLVVLVYAIVLAPMAVQSLVFSENVILGIKASLGGVDSSSESSFALYYGPILAFLQAVKIFGKPLLPVQAVAFESCVADSISCIADAVNGVGGLFFVLGIVLVLLISLVFLFLLQEVVLSEQTVKQAAGKCWSYFKNNFGEVSMVWLASAAIFAVISAVVSLAGLFIPVLPAYLSQVFAFLTVVVFQTCYYTRFVERTG